MATALLKDLPEWFKTTPQGAEMVAAAEVNVIEERRAHVATIAAAEKEFQKVAPKLEAARQQAEDNVNAAKAALARAEEGYRRAYGDLSGAQALRDSKCHHARTELTWEAPGVAAFKQEIMNLRDKIMREPGPYGGRDHPEHHARDAFSKRAIEAYRSMETVALEVDPRPTIAALRAEFGLPPMADAE